MTPDSRITKLPVWAQTKLKVTQMRLAEAEARIASLLPGAASNTHWEDVGKPRSLPNDALISFQVDNSAGDKITVHIDEGALYINGLRRLMVYPEAANALRIRLVPLGQG